MSTFQSEYENTTSQIDEVISSQLTSVLDWQNISGNLIKVSSSSSGYAWGYSSDNRVWSCQLPCSGNWQPSDLSSFSVQSILDIATDEGTVYVLFTPLTGITKILMTDASRQGSWSMISVPISATNIFSTHTYIWVQDANNRKQMCPKPCTMSNWIPSSETTIKITSSSDKTLYGKDANGQPVQTDETMHSGWDPLREFGDTKVQSVIGSDSGMYAIDDSLIPIYYDGKQTQPLATSGYTPMNITAGNNQLWMTSATPSSLGNVFTRLEKPDYTTLINKVRVLDKKRDNLVSDVTKKFDQQTDIMTVNKQSQDIITFFKNMFNIDGNTSKKAKTQIGHLNERIRSTQEELDQMNAIQPILQIVVGMLLAICLAYILIGEYAHIPALLILGVGAYFILNSKYNG
jgi:hypothetical protein